MFFRLCLVASLNVGGLSSPTDTSQGSGDGEYPLVKLLDQFAQNDVEHYLSLLDDYKDFVPEEYHEILDGLGQLINTTYHEEPWIFNYFYSTLRDLSLYISERALDNMADAYDELTSGRLSVPTTLLELTGYIRKKNPELFERARALLILSLQKFDQLQPETKLALAKVVKCRFNSTFVRIFTLKKSPPDSGYNDICDSVKNAEKPLSAHQFSGSLWEELERCWGGRTLLLDDASPETHFVKNYDACYNYASEALSDPSKVSAEQIAALISNLKSLYDNSSDDIKQDIRTQWPDAYNLLESRFAANIAKMAENYANSGNPDNYKVSPKIGYMPKCCE